MGTLGRLFPQVYTLGFYRFLFKALGIVAYVFLLSIIFGILTRDYNSRGSRPTAALPRRPQRPNVSLPLGLGEVTPAAADAAQALPVLGGVAKRVLTNERVLQSLHEDLDVRAATGDGPRNTDSAVKNAIETLETAGSREEFIERSREMVERMRRDK
jgi:hypothetical protein